MSPWMILVVGVVVLLVVVLLLASTRPNDFRIARRLRIAAPAERIFAKVNDLAEWQSWSPWEKKDPGMQRQYSAATAGVGATYGWIGNREVGEGRMTILEAQPPSHLRIRLEFLAPFKITHEAEFTFREDGATTEVEWAMTGSHPFIGKVMCLFFNPDKMVGKDFEAGLATLRQLTEQPA